LANLAGGEINDFANRLFEKWGVGDEDRDNALLFLIAVEDRKMRVEVGYGLEGLIPDARAGRILDERVLPWFRQGQMGEGVMQGALALAQISAGDAGIQLTGEVQARAPPGSRGGGGFFKGLFGLLTMLVLLALFGRNPFLAMLIFSSMSRGGYRSGGFGRGGFGGGGFGGFGGGLSGGGGATRGW
jgi:uncharacterized protein